MPLSGYTGSKGGTSTLPKLLGWMPRHTRYCEPFMGHGAVLLAKRPVQFDIGIDLDVDAVNAVRAEALRTSRSPLVIRSDGLRFLRKSLQWAGAEWLIYLDPPYLIEGKNGRRRGRYRFEMEMRDQHQELLELVMQSRAHVMLSGPPTTLYIEMLTDAPGWRCERYDAMTRGGLKPECCWMNFSLDVPRHHPELAGGNFRERERRKRKAMRWVKRFRAMPPSERQLVAEALATCSHPTFDDAAGKLAIRDDAGSGGKCNA